MFELYNIGQTDENQMIKRVRYNPCDDGIVPCTNHPEGQKWYYKKLLPQPSYDPETEELEYTRRIEGGFIKIEYIKVVL